MKFHHKEKAREGDWRVKTKFAFLPIRIGNETRWLEVVSTNQKYTFYMYGLSCWENESFAKP